MLTLHLNCAHYKQARPERKSVIQSITSSTHLKNHFVVIFLFWDVLLLLFWKHLDTYSAEKHFASRAAQHRPGLLLRHSTAGRWLRRGLLIHLSHPKESQLDVETRDASTLESTLQINMSKLSTWDFLSRDDGEQMRWCTVSATQHLSGIYITKSSG